MDANGILHGLNDSQRASVTSPSDVLQVLAPPGSGKTKTLTARVAYLIAFCQLRPCNIITCTFTRKAANEMKERIQNFVGRETARQIKLGTFHAIAVQYLKQYGQHIGLNKDFGIADSSDSKAILKRIITRNKFTIQPNQALGRISAQKVKGLDSDYLFRTAKHVGQQEFAQVFAEYEAELRASNLLDYDDLLLRCCFLMKTHPQCVSNVEAVLIDEFQDTNTVQYELMGLFAQKQNVITIVGDPDQSIYGFRSAEVKNLARMKKQWPDTLTINLKENYRSSGAILHAAQHIIEQDESRPPKKLQATHSPGQRPVLRKLPTAMAEATWLVSEIRRIQALSGDVLQYSDFAVLLRSAALSRSIENGLGKEGIPYRMVGGVRFFDRAEVKLILDYLRVIHQPSNAEAVERIVNVPSRRIGEATVKSLHEEASSRKVSLWALVRDAAQGQRIQTKLSAPSQKGLASFVNIILSGRRRLQDAKDEPCSLVDMLNLVIKKIDLQKFLKQKYEDDNESRWANVEELLAQAADMSDPARMKAIVEENSLPMIDGLEQQDLSGQDSLSVFLANVALTSSTEEKTGEDGNTVQQVTVSTIHSAKGLEWPVVFIPACFEGSIPHSRAEDHDEERRLLYVGMTRAQAMLYLSCPIKNSQREDTTLSTFLKQPGMSSFFEEHGPNMGVVSAKELAEVLRRQAPTLETFEKGERTLDSDQDNYWPLNGENPREELAKWNYGKAVEAQSSLSLAGAVPWGAKRTVTMNDQQGFSTASSTLKTGFISLKDRYDEILEQERLQKFDKRAKAQAEKDKTDRTKGSKRKIEGDGGIASFFSKRRQKSSVHTAHADEDAHDLGGTRNTASTNPTQTFGQDTNNSAKSPDSPPAHKPRTAPLTLKPHRDSRLEEPCNTYVFLSSSPPPPGSPDKYVNPVNTFEAIETTGSSTKVAEARQPSLVRPASTLHTTSMDYVQQGQGRRQRTYGVRPSFNGWANRGRK